MSNTIDLSVAQALSQLPDPNGHFGPYGGRFVSETLTHALDSLAADYARLKNDPDFQATIDHDLQDFRRPSQPAVPRTALECRNRRSPDLVQA